MFLEFWQGESEFFRFGEMNTSDILTVYVAHSVFENN